MKLAQVRINRSEHLAPVITVGEWEIPVLQYIYDPEKVEVLSRMRDKRPYPEPQQEFVRLELRYGVDTEDGKSYASVAYGQGVMGAKTIEQLIEAEKAAEAALGDSLPFMSTELNVVYNPDQEVIDAAREAQKTPAELLPRSDQNAALLAQALEQNKQLLALLAARGASIAGGVAEGVAEGTVEKPTLSLKAKSAATA